jgi:beta-mannosidase
MRDAYGERLLTWQPSTGRPLPAGGPRTAIEPGAVVRPEDDPALIAVNDGVRPWTVHATISRRTLAGDVLASVVLTATVPAGDAIPLTPPAELVTAGDPASELIVAEAGNLRALWFFTEDRNVAWPAADFTTSVERSPGEHRVTVTARSILRSLTLFPDRLDPAAETDRAAVTVLPGESVTFTVRSDRELDARALSTRPVLRSVND